MAKIEMPCPCCGRLISTDNGILNVDMPIEFFDENDTEEIIPNCTVIIMTNKKTGRQFFAWRREEE